jgi:hypothetical protein
MAMFVVIVVGVAVAVTVIAMLADLAGFPPSGAAIGGVIGGVIAATMIAGSGGRTCSRCGTQLPRIRRPTSLKQALWGGWTCPNCGAEVDRQGNPAGGSAAGA